MLMQNPSPSTAGNLPFSFQEHEWDISGWIPDKPKNWDYGYVVSGQTIGSTREHLVELLVSRGSEISFVWTPETPEPVPPENVPFLVEAFRRIETRKARNGILAGAAFVGIAVVLALGLQNWDILYRNIFFLFGGLALVEGVWVFARARRYTQEEAMSDASTARFASWLKNKNLSGYTITLGACIVVVGVAQLLVRNSIEASGLVKPAVRSGEVWRIFTATLMHGNFTHFWMNGVALIHFAKILEQTVQRAYVPLVFLITGAVGSVFSVVLYPNTTSIGASGGLMGLLGFITIAAYFDRNRFPPKYFRQMIEAIVSVGVFGIIGFAFIDNAAHLGGLIGGILLGLLLLRNNAHNVKSTDNVLKFASLVCLVVLALIAAIAIYHMAR
jgi:membrane associated rhomboid family serine protease